MNTYQTQSYRCFTIYKFKFLGMSITIIFWINCTKRIRQGGDHNV